MKKTILYGIVVFAAVLMLCTAILAAAEAPPAAVPDEPIRSAVSLREEQCARGLLQTGLPGLYTGGFPTPSSDQGGSIP